MDQGGGFADSFHFELFARQDERNQHGAAIDAAQSLASVDQFFNFEF